MGTNTVTSGINYSIDGGATTESVSGLSLATGIFMRLTMEQMGPTAAGVYDILSGQVT